MRKQDTYNEIMDRRVEETSIDNNSGLFVDTTNVGKYTKKEEKVLSRVQALHKRAGHIRSRVGQSASIGVQHTNTFMRSTVQLVLWLLAFVMSLTMVCCLSTNKGTLNEVNAVSGTAISTVDELKAVANNLSGSYYLANDITVTDSTWTPIGTSSSSTFKGTFDGNGYSITFTQTIHITSSSGSAYGGLFGYLTSATIKNLGVIWSEDSIDININGETEPYTGLVVSSKSSVHAGGIVGYASVSIISNCYNMGAVSAESASSTAYAGGIVGNNNNSSIISNCYNTGAVKATASASSKTAYAGGIVGDSDNPISNCYNTGAVSAESASSTAYAGGIVGDAGNPISNCYNTGAVKATTSASSKTAYAGGIAGNGGYGTTISNCFSIDPNLSDSINTSPSAEVNKAVNLTNVGGIVGSGGTVNYGYHNYVSLDNINKGTYVETLASFLVYSNNNASIIIDNYKFGFTVNTINYGWDSACTWNFDIIWKVNTDASTSNTQPLIINMRIPQFSGEGTADSPYIISNSDDLKSLSSAVSVGLLNDSYYRVESQNLNKVIEITDNTWTPIGTSSSSAFTGTFDGNGHSITFTQTIYITSSSGDVYGGLFGYASDATISNLEVNWAGTNTISNYTGLIVSSTTSTAYAGGIAGYGEKISNCYSTGAVTATSTHTSSNAYAGGIAGYCGTINSCYNEGAVTAISTTYDAYAGGIAGKVVDLICNCYNTGTVTVTDSRYAYAGGISGKASSSTTIINCYNTGAVDATSTSSFVYAGGIVGYAEEATSSNCYNTGAVDATSTSSSVYAGGIVGYAKEATSSNCFSIDPNPDDDIDTTPSGKTVGAIVGSGGTVNYCYHNYSSINTTTTGTATIYNSNLAGLVKQKDEFLALTWDPIYLWNFNIVWEVNTDDSTSTTQPLIINIRVPFTGAGTEESPYIISDSDDLKSLSYGINLGLWNDSHFRVESQNQNKVIEITDNTWTPIGTSSSSAFEGTFDGNGHTVKFAQTIQITCTYGGLFGYTKGAAIKNLGVNWAGTNKVSEYTGLVVSPTYRNIYVGGIAGYSDSTTFNNCDITGSITGSSNGYVGGIVGQAIIDTTISDCNNKGTVSSISPDDSAGVGGIAGYASSTIISHCDNIGNLFATARNAYAGGISGNASSSTINNCKNTAEVVAESTDRSSSYAYAGGIAGYAYSSTISVCDNTGAVSADSNSKDSDAYAHAGGIVGGAPSTTISDCNNTPVDTNTVTANSYSSYRSNYSGFKYSSAYAGGIVGRDGNIINCNNTGTVKADASKPVNYYDVSPFAYAGGICGSDGIISNCHNEGAVSATGDSARIYTGGIVGYSRKTISNCYNIGVVSVDGSSSADVGGIAGYAYSSTINNCYNTGSVTATTPSATNAGGIVGYASSSTISNCHNKGAVDATSTYISSNAYAGGIAGYASSSSSITISNCYNTGAVKATTTDSSARAHAGGIVGYASSSITISNCYNTGDVTVTINDFSAKSNTANAGGIAGYASSSTTISNCYNIGAVKATATRTSSNAYAGGIVGQNANINNCYNTGKVTVSAYSSAYAGGIVGSGGTISNCFSIDSNLSDSTNTAPSATGSTKNVGGIVGNSGTVNNSYHNYSGLSTTTGYVLNLENFLKYPNNNNSINSNVIQDNFTLGFGTLSNGTYQYQWDDTSPWDLMSVWGIDTRTDINEADRINGGLPYLKWFEEDYITYVVTNGDTTEEKRVFCGIKGTVTSVIVVSVQNAGLTIPNGTIFSNWVDVEGKTYNVGDTIPFTEGIVLNAVLIEMPMVTFNVTNNVCAILNVYDSNDNFVQQVFIDKNSSQQTISTYLLKGEVYTVRISVFYTANITLDTDNSMTGVSMSGRTLTFEVSDSGNTITMQITGFSGGNGIVV